MFVKVRTEIVSANHVLILQIDVWSNIDDNTIKHPYQIVLLLEMPMMRLQK